VNINATLLVQMITFLTFIWFTMKFVWPPLIKALDDRQNKVAEGLAAAERGHRELELAHLRGTEELRKAKVEYADIIEQANRRATQMIEDAKQQAIIEGQRLAHLAQEQIAQELNQAKETLRQQYAALTIAGAEKILGREIDASANSAIIDKLIKEI